VRNPVNDLDRGIKGWIVVGNRGWKLAKLRRRNHESSIGAGNLIPALAHARIMAALKDQQDATFATEVEPLCVVLELGK